MSSWEVTVHQFQSLDIALQDIILWVTMEKLVNALPILQAHVGGASTLENEIDRALSMLRR